MRQAFLDSIPSAGTEILVDGDEGHYLSRVLRVRPGEAVRLADARGGAAESAVLEVRPGGALLRVGPPETDPAPGLECALELCPPRGEALDLALEMAVQLGVSAVRLVGSERTLARPGEGPLKPERLRRRLREACRQCLRSAVPDLWEPAAFDEACAPVSGFAGAALLMLSERGGARPPALAAGRVRLMVGPEGGFTAAEFARAQAAGWTRVSLGPLPLKTATAVAAGLAALAALAGSAGAGAAQEPSQP